MTESEQAILEAVNDNSKETHRRIDKLVDSVGGVQVSMGEMKVTLGGVKEDVNGHLEDHKQSSRNVFKGVLTTVFTVGGLVIAAWIVYSAGWV